jgi:hypothetical protein
LKRTRLTHSFRRRRRFANDFELPVTLEGMTKSLPDNVMIVDRQNLCSSSPSIGGQPVDCRPNPRHLIGACPGSERAGAGAA